MTIALLLAKETDMSIALVILESTVIDEDLVIEVELIALVGVYLNNIKSNDKVNNNPPTPLSSTRT